MTPDKIKVRVAQTQAPEPAPAPVVPAAAPSPATTASKTGSRTILVVEDDQFLVKAYKVKFEKEGFTVVVARDGKEALALLEKDPPGVVLLDLMLPEVSGFDVLSAMRENDRWAKVPVLILSNLGQAQDMQRGQELGAAEYVIKANMRIGDIVEKVKKYLS